MLTIGDFARASRLSAKALRRYDELGLLPPARVDPFTGYRYYAVEQLERARLIAWLRGIGMPLAEVGRVCAMYASDAAAAARAIRDYWARVESETEARRDLAASLVDRLRGHTEMTDGMTDEMNVGATSGATTGATTGRTDAPAFVLRTAVRLDRGLVRAAQQDAAHAGPHLLAVADGYGPEGERAALAAVGALEAVPPPAPSARAGDVLNALEDAVRTADSAVSGLADSGTTLTAAVWTGGRLALAHVGDSRAYLLRDGTLVRLTRDHTVVQALVDAGELDPAEAADRPDRALLLKALDGGDVPPEPELGVHETRPGDRYLLCTDGLSAVAPAEDIRRALAAGVGPDDAAGALVALARSLGGPDNVACVVADVVPG
ncbi:MerR family transcriptional regulator [Streptomyces sp. NBC_00572]|uniref:MerR family transcriptional regulator n=1 Tax=Streptomyces sp. NBC_00572 TaxID=2903664 RepID=UPI002258A40F|nr:MerR family transcriptional regulator [Streptomyces sp. NBC_00572]MCX4981938.1 MerR family transcriptional regulator [Streptomyces sp. NBC_00572]